MRLLPWLGVMAAGRTKSPHSLKVKCPTWDHVESFYLRKVGADNRLSMRVPFLIDSGAKLVLALELPNEMVMAIDGTVTSAVPAADNKKSAIKLTLHGLTNEVRQRLGTLVEDARSGHSIADDDDDDYDAYEEFSGPPTAVPADAPVDELIEPPPMLTLADVAADEKQVFVGLDSDLHQMRERAAHEVLGVGWDASVADIRLAYFSQTKRYHPDVFTKYRSAAIRHLSQEVFIHVNKAYDRMRDVAVANGAAIVAGPALLPHDGWLADLDDIGDEPETPLPGPLPSHESSGQIRLPKVPVPEPEPVRPAQMVKPPPAAAASPIAAPPAPSVRFNATAPGEDAPAQAAADKLLSADSLFGDIDLGSRPDMKIPVAPETVDASELGADCCDLLDRGEYKLAQAKLAEAPRVEPRNRSLRALYHVASGRALLDKGEAVQATAQFEAALAHDRDCEAAKTAIEDLRSSHSDDKRGGLFRRIFK